MLRPSREQIDAGIVDAAAAMFAEHGYERTSLREIADAVGYSKTGLLHRVRSKEALRDTVAERCVAAVRDVLARVEPLPPGPERDAAAIEALADLAASAPGRLSLALAHDGGLVGTPAGEVLAQVPGLLGRCFAIDPAIDPAPEGGPGAPAALERRVRVTAALAVVGTLTLAFPTTPQHLLRPHLVALALGALGRPAAPAAP